MRTPLTALAAVPVLAKLNIYEGVRIHDLAVRRQAFRVRWDCLDSRPIRSTNHRRLRIPRALEDVGPRPERRR